MDARMTEWSYDFNVGNGEITVMMNDAWDAKRNKISLDPWLLHLYLAKHWIFASGEPGASAE
jgi:hypothetical protein